MLCAGIDAGSRTIKALIYDPARDRVVTEAVADQGVGQAARAQALYAQALERAGRAREDVLRVVATGYGRHKVDVADRAATEITCHAAGVCHDHPKARTVLDIGGQDSKLLRLSPRGTVDEFAMNDRCAAGTGRFLEVVAQRLDVSLGDLGRMACRSEEPARITSLCVVFAETEIVGLLAEGVEPGAVASGVEQSIAARMAAMAGEMVQEPVLFTGGVALVPGMDRALAQALHASVQVADRPQMAGALGAALLAARDLVQGEQGAQPA